MIDLKLDYELRDISANEYSASSALLLKDDDYRSKYERILGGVLAEAKFKPGDWYTNMWPACRIESTNPSVLIVGRATRGQWAARLDRSDFPVDSAIDIAARKKMYWVDSVPSQYIRTAIAIVNELPDSYRNHREEPSLDIIWSDLYKIARTGNPTKREMSIQGSLGTGELLAREVEILKPKLILAFTQIYDRKTRTVSGGWFEDIMGECERTTEAPSAAPLFTTIGGVPCVVGAHPQAGPARNIYIADVLQTLAVGSGGSSSR